MGDVVYYGVFDLEKIKNMENTVRHSAFDLVSLK